MSRLLVDDVTKTDRRALLNVNKMATISDIVAPTREYEDDRQNKRIAVIEEDTKAIHKLTASIEKLVIQMQDMLSEQKEQSERIKRLEEEPGNAWNAVKKKAVDTVVGLVAGALATGLIYMIAQNM